MVAKIEFRDLKTDKVLWAESGRWRSASSTTSRRRRRRLDPNAFLGQNVNAMERLTSEFARTIVSAILESF